MKQKSAIDMTKDFFAYAEKLNPKCESLSVEKLRTFPGCENYTEEQAEEVIKSLELLALILFENVEENSICIDNQQVVNLKEQPKIISINTPKTKNRAA